MIGSSNPYSSIRHYEAAQDDDWIMTGRVLDLFPSKQDYFEFVEDYEDIHDLYERIKHELAN